MTSKHLVIMAAGTGGHIIPGLAVAEEMRQRGWSVSWMGTELGLENKLVPPSGIPLDRMAFAGLRGKGLMHTVKGLFKLVQAFVQSRQVFVTRSADAVLGMGGYVCFPGGLMAWLSGKPLMLVNADAAMLMSNASLKHFARRIAFGFDGAAAAATAKAVVTGNPVRAEIEAIAPPEQRFAGRSGPLRILVVGGSLGAKAINEVLPKALALWPAESRPQVLHQTGQVNLAAVQQGYREAGLALGNGLELRPFIEDMAEQLAQADLIICRAGAVTVSELCAAGLPSVLVPLVVSTTSHQRDNAQYMAQHAAAIHLPQPELSAQALYELLHSQDRDSLLQMAQRARALARPRAAARVADELEALVSPQS
ncbi:UDP-N-acetylglucosamine--N-acetylmuramyl-(pentapeptide) pyrophosphoryl-undecaprenol N-acetylglucosamine transferase [Paucibacter oligotrophus]|uniref:UDP-N-acetylglucosamine--N-acetylmuramyl-(pentapeptide) pyrophosphoryl-undecaprenol N-acetylglucosamine transferase n=1 Tax=Roseateles oligotrophus TaxID=1769250 RepID=A0A840LF39_9BURK|nr:undecaprenyldiphospho-muramoylpentapeptide beta-N-acetylglucosaminyltransferase [Roseateles oligotrophus]MBB4845263.1 UDP-N-acetylglucosamine--N-acetylmuramyl-(pentapeptide) pyrophosphoryl-undecaprenol N-acetylglucosamine transferase [Roseateles oligotrophus]